jgi:hypothetical protein
MKYFNHTTTFKKFKVLLQEDLRQEQVGLKKSKYSAVMNIDAPLHFN